MAIAQTLPIYKDTYLFSKELLNLDKQLPKMYKPTIGRRMIDYSLELFYCIESTNRSRVAEERRYYLEQYQIKFNVVLTLLRLCHDLRIMSQKKYAHLMTMAEAMSKQVTGWKNSIK